MVKLMIVLIYFVNLSPMDTKIKINKYNMLIIELRALKKSLQLTQPK